VNKGNSFGILLPSMLHEKKGCGSFIEKNPAATVPCKRTIHRTAGKFSVTGLELANKKTRTLLCDLR
jgi:hypothetical protein